MLADGVINSLRAAVDALRNSLGMMSCDSAATSSKSVEFRPFGLTGKTAQLTRPIGKLSNSVAFGLRDRV